METENKNPLEDVFEDRCHPDACRHMPFPAPHWTEDDTCSHCGGLRPSIVLKGIREGAEVVPTDKGYKIYVALPEPNPDEVVIVGTANFKPEQGDFHEVTPEIMEKYGKRHLLKLGNWVQFAPRGPIRRVKCYLNHFSESQALEFVRLHEAGKMKLAYPGHFYRPLAFGRYKAAIEQLLVELKAKPE